MTNLDESLIVADLDESYPLQAGGQHLSCMRLRVPSRVNSEGLGYDKS